MNICALIRPGMQHVSNLARKLARMGDGLPLSTKQAKEIVELVEQLHPFDKLPLQIARQTSTARPPHRR